MITISRGRAVRASIVALCATGSLILLFAFGTSSASAATTPEAVPGELIVGFKPGTSASKSRSIVGKRSDARVDERLATGDVVVTVPRGESAAQVEAKLERDSRVEYVEPNYIVRANMVTNDPFIRDGSQWGTMHTRAPLAWGSNRGAGALVAVIDSGITLSNPDLFGNVWRNVGEVPNNGVDDDGNGFVDDYYGADWIDGDGNPNDEAGHGTHVAGTVAAISDNGVGGAGVAPHATVLPLRFLDRNGAGNVGDAIAAIEYAVSKGVDVINASWGGPAYSAPLEAAIRFAGQHGVVFVAAAGNDGTNNDIAPNYPASMNLPTMISVAASERSDGLAGFSNYGRNTVDVAAPGAEILSTLGNGFGYYSGTSMAAPHVAGVAALLRAKDQSVSAESIGYAINIGAKKVPALSSKLLSGGVVDVVGAYQALGWATSEFDLGSPPRAFRLRSPGKRVRMKRRSGKVKFKWSRARDTDFSHYELIINGKVRKRTKRHAAKIKLRTGKRIRWSVVAVDKAGNTRKARSGKYRGRVAIARKSSRKRR